MKLLFVTDNGFSSKGEYFYYSGANVQHYLTVTKFFDDIVFIARNNKYDPSYNRISTKYKTYLVDSITSGKMFLKNYFDLIKILETEIKNADAVMCFGLNGYLAYKKAKKYNKPVIYYVGGCVYDTLKNMDSVLKRRLAPIMMKLMKNVAKNADYVHYVDEYLFEKYPTKGEHLICPSVRIEIIDSVLSKRLAKIDSKEEKTILGIIGYTHNKIKGIDTAIKALSLLDKNYILQVVGRGDHAWLDKIASDYGVLDRVQFLGVLEGRDKIFEWLDTIDIYLQPSLTEGMPRATLEAMSRACPVISTSVGGLKKIIDERYRVKINDYHGIAEKVNILSNNKALLIRAAKTNFHIAKSFDIKILDRKRDMFYKNIIKKLILQKRR